MAQVMNSARLLWAAIPLDARRRIGRPPKTSTRATPRQPKQLNSSELSFPPAFLATIQRWENDPLSFFKESNFEIGSTSSALVQIYIYMEDLELRKEKDLVRSRFMKVLYYRLKDRLCLTYVRANDVETVAQIISKTGMARSEPETIQKNISKWIKEGRKIDALCKDVNTVKSLENTHLGVLFCLPQDIHDEL